MFRHQKFVCRHYYSVLAPSSATAATAVVAPSFVAEADNTTTTTIITTKASIPTSKYYCGHHSTSSSLWPQLLSCGWSNNNHNKNRNYYDLITITKKGDLLFPVASSPSTTPFNACARRFASRRCGGTSKKSAQRETISDRDDKILDILHDMASSMDSFRTTLEENKEAMKKNQLKTNAKLDENKKEMNSKLEENKKEMKATLEENKKELNAKLEENKKEMNAKLEEIKNDARRFETVLTSQMHGWVRGAAATFVSCLGTVALGAWYFTTDQSLKVQRATITAESVDRKLDGLMSGDVVNGRVKMALDEAKPMNTAK